MPSVGARALAVCLLVLLPDAYGRDLSLDPRGMHRASASEELQQRIHHSAGGHSLLNAHFSVQRTQPGQGARCGGLAPTEDEKKVSFMLLGQQKCGTSSLWNLLTQHPRLAMAGHRKENFYWATGGAEHQELRWDACMWPLGGYQAFLEHDHAFEHMCPGELLGDFTATHFSCPCCPERFSQLDKDLKLIAVLREPLARSQSRFAEQQKMNGRFMDVSFAEMSEKEVRWIAESHTCQANRYLPKDIPELNEARELWCSALSNIVGWSNYPVYLHNWLKHFRKDQLLIIYTEQIDKNPLPVLRAVEEFLGVAAFEYPEDVLGHAHFNSGSCGYGWKDGCEETNHKTVLGRAEVPDADPELDPYFDEIVRGVMDLAREGRVTLPPMSWLAGGRMERLGMSDEKYKAIQMQQLGHSSPMHGQAYGRMVEQLHLA